MANTGVTFFRGTKTSCTQREIQDGQILFETDQGEANKIYNDVGTTRVQIGGKNIVDQTYSTTSTNAIANKVVKNSVDGLTKDISNILSNLDIMTIEFTPQSIANEKGGTVCKGGLANGVYAFFVSYYANVPSIENGEITVDLITGSDNRYSRTGIKTINGTSCVGFCSTFDVSKNATSAGVVPYSIIITNNTGSTIEIPSIKVGASHNFLKIIKLKQF